MKTESYTHQVVEFLRTKEIGHTFTSRSLHEDIVTTPGQRHIPNPDLVSAALTRQRRLGAIMAVAKKPAKGGGEYYEMTLVAPEKMLAMFTMRKPGKHDACKAPRDLKSEEQPDLLTPPNAEQAPNMPEPMAYVPSEPEALEGMAEVKHHIRMAFRAYKKRLLHPLPEIAVKSIPTDILLEELTRRVKNAKAE